MVKKKYKIGDIVEYGWIPCKKCGQAHHRIVRELRPNGDILLATWEDEDGHFYERISKDTIIHLLIGINQRLEKKLWKCLNKKS